MDFEPPRPTGSSREARFQQYVADQVGRTLIPRGSNTIKIDRRSTGFSARIAAPFAVAPLSAPKSFYYLKSFGDYILCAQNADGTGTQTRIAKPTNLRNSIDAELIFGTLWTITYTTTGDTAYLERSKTSGSLTEDQYVSPFFQTYTDDTDATIVMAVQCATGVTTQAEDADVTTGTPVTWLQSSPYQLWTKK